MKLSLQGIATIKPMIVLPISLLFIGFSLQVFSQRVGIGTTQPLARLAIDSGLMVDQLSANMGTLSPGIIFGNEGRVGISSSRLNGSALRGGLSFFVGGFRRISIDSLGNVALGIDPVSDYRLYVSGSVRISNLLHVPSKIETGDLSLNGRLLLNTSVSHDALMYLKGRSGTPDNWGMHIVMEDVNSTDSGAILYDGDMKFKVFRTGAGYFFRDENNSTLMRISSSGAITADGRGMVQSNSSDQLQLVPYISQPNIDFLLNPGGSFSFPISYTAFTSPPLISPAQWSAVSDASHLVCTAIDITSTSATIVVRNVGSAAVTGTNARFRAIIVGERN